LKIAKNQSKLSILPKALSLSKNPKNPKKIPALIDIIFQNPSEILVLNGY
jgi:hypothetical protein